MIYELARILADAYLEEERSQEKEQSVYFGLNANIPVRDHVTDYGVITFYEFLTRIPSQLQEPDHP